MNVTPLRFFRIITSRSSSGGPRHTRAISPILALIVLLVLAGRSDACTIFVLTDANQALFCNNEDWKEARTWIWFVPGKPSGKSQKKYGCAYVGFSTHWGQGGVNAEGLAFDWVAGYQAAWQRAPGMESVRGNPAERMLEQCATVQEAITFFQSHWEPSFSYAKILVADRTGASVIISAANGQMEIQRETASRGLGFGGSAVEAGLVQDASPTLANAAKILQASRQQGQYATRYSNVFDLKSGGIFVSTDQSHFARLDLATELKKGRHSYGLQAIAKSSEVEPSLHE